MLTSNLRNGLFFTILIISTIVNGDETFQQPRIEGVYLDWCNTWSKQCGKHVADKFCKREGLQSSTGFKQSKKDANTIMIGNRYNCHSAGCRGFEFIKCGPSVAVKVVSAKVISTRKVVDRPQQSSEKRFPRPNINGVPLDWCLQGTSGCGFLAADQFCRVKGYDHSLSYRVTPDVTRTVNINTQKVCLTRKCSAFLYVICKR